jgi:hypothetical protein
MLPRRRFLAAAALAPAGLALPRFALAQDAADRLIVPGERVGLIRMATKPDGLAGLYGAANVAAGPVPGPEGSESPGAFVFKGKADELRVYFSEDGKTIWTVQIVAEKSPWKTRGGLGIGSTVAAVERANGRPFLISGFGWDMGGLVVDWRGGALKGIGFGFNPTRELSPAEQRRISGDNVKVASNNPLVLKAAPVVSEIQVQFPR